MSLKGNELSEQRLGGQRKKSQEFKHRKPDNNLFTHTSNKPFRSEVSSKMAEINVLIRAPQVNSSPSMQE